jgi:hypothetical protein
VWSFAELDRLQRELQSQTNENSRLKKQLEALQSEVISAREQNSAAPSGEFMTDGMLYQRRFRVVQESSLEFAHSV